jgi:hypothetical protein
VKLLRQRIECNDVGRLWRGWREIDGDGSVYQASSSRTAKPALDGVEMWATGCAEDDERSTSKQKEIIEEEWVKASALAGEELKLCSRGKVSMLTLA